MIYHLVVFFRSTLLAHIKRCHPEYDGDVINDDKTAEGYEDDADPEYFPEEEDDPITPSSHKKSSEPRYNPSTAQSQPQPFKPKARRTYYKGGRGGRRGRGRGRGRGGKGKQYMKIYSVFYIPRLMSK